MKISKTIINYFNNKSINNAVKAFDLLDPSARQKVIEDLVRYEKWNPDNFKQSLIETLCYKPPFRSIFLYRIEKSCNYEATELYKQFLSLYPAPSGIEIYGEIEGGLKIKHNNSIIHVEYAGKNLSVGPFVVIGKKGGKAPFIGNNVTICANSTVMGGIHLGDGVFCQ